MKAGPPLRFRYLGLSGRVFLTMLAALTLGLAGFAVVAVQALENSTQRVLQERLTLAQMTAGRIDDLVAQTIGVTETMVDVTGLASEQATIEDQQRFAAGLYDHLDGMAYYVAIIDPNFRSRLVYPPQDEVLTHDFSDSNCVNHAFDQGLPQVTRSFTIGTPTPAIAMVVPITGSSGAVIRVVLVNMDLNAPHFANLLQPGELGETGIIEIIDRTGIVLGATRPELRWRQDEHDGFFETLILERRTSVDTCHNCHDVSVTGEKAEDLLAFAPLSVAPWGVAVRQSRDEAFVDTDTLRRRLLFFGGLVFLAAGAAALGVTRSLVKPLRGLTTACSEIAEGNLDVPLPERGPAEVGLLGAAFDTMRQRLKQSLEKISAWNNELEELVAELSQELETSRQELIEANRDLNALNRLSFALTQSMDVPKTVNTALDSVIELTGMEGGWICLLDGESAHGIAARGELCSDRTCICDSPSARSMIEQCTSGGQALAATVSLRSPEDGNLERHAQSRQYLLVCVPLPAKGHTVGLLSLISSKGHASPDMDLALLTSIGAQVGTAVQNALLYRAVRVGEQAHRELLHKVIGAQEEERRRIARELHDETSQALTALSVGLETALRAPAETPEDVQSRLLPMKTLTTNMSHELQRMIQDLRPSLLDDLGLIPAIDWYTEARLKGQGTRIAWEITGDEHRLPTEVETTIFRIAQEAISNVARHAHAENLRFYLEYLDTKVLLAIEDDGQGFEPDEVLSSPQVSGAYGLMGMQERVTLLGGSLVIDSEPGQGTRISVAIPATDRRDKNGQDPRLAG